MLIEYFRLIFWPQHLYFEKPNIGYLYFGWQGLIGILILTIGGIYAVASYMKQRVFMLSYLIFFIALFPVSGILVVANFKYADHWLYVSIIGVLFLFAFMFDRISSNVAKKVFATLAIIALILLGYRLYERNKEWADPVLFFENDFKVIDSFFYAVEKGFGGWNPRC